MVDISRWVEPNANTMALKPQAPSGENGATIRAIIGTPTTLPPVRAADVTFAADGSEVDGEGMLVHHKLAGAAQKRSKAHAACDAQEAALHELGNALEALETKLESVLITPDGDEDTPPFSEASLQERQKSITTRIRFLTHQVLQMCERADA
jgi:hypothetical protein